MNFAGVSEVPMMDTDGQMGGNSEEVGQVFFSIINFFMQVGNKSLYKVLSVSKNEFCIYRGIFESKD